MNAGEEPKGPFYCSDYSRANEEQLCGTAKPIDVWFLIEHRGKWERDAINSLSPAARAVVQEVYSHYSRVRFGLIRQTGRTAGPLTGFLALSRESDARLCRFEIDSLDDLPSTPILRLLAELRASEIEHRKQELFLVCTHGVHDRCCAKFGHALSETMTRIAGGAVWQVSHVGGCRFAPNVICLPDGVVYGRLRELDCPSLITSYAGGLIACSHLRGRSCYPKPVQAAEYFLRTERRLERLDDLELTHSQETSPRLWRIGFRQRQSRERYEIQLSSEEAAGTYKSCSAHTPLPRQRFQLYTVLALGSRE